MASNDPPKSPTGRTGYSQLLFKMPMIETKSFDIKERTGNQYPGYGSPEIKKRPLKAVDTKSDMSGRSPSKDKASPRFVGQVAEVFGPYVTRENRKQINTAPTDGATYRLIEDDINRQNNDESGGKKVIELSPTAGEFQNWRFAAHCRSIQKRIVDILQTKIKFNDEGLIQFKVESGYPNEQIVRDTIGRSCQDIKSHTFKVKLEDSEEFTVDIESLKNRRATRQRPVNPYQTGDAQIYVDEREPICDVVLLSVDTYFQTCCDDLQHIISRYEPVSSDGKDKTIPSNTNGQNKQQTRVTSMTMFCEEWKFDYLKSFDSTFATFEKPFDVEIKMKDKETLEIIGRNLEHITQVQRELENVIKCLVRVTPGNYELYVWRLAFRYQELVDRINLQFQHSCDQIQFYDEGNYERPNIIVQFKTNRNMLTDSDIRALITEACIDIKTCDFNFPVKARTDVDQDIGYLKEKKETELRPHNPFLLKAAEVYLVQGERSQQCKLVLVCRQKFFKTCHDDVRMIIEKYAKKLKMDKVPDNDDKLEEDVYEDITNNGVIVNKAADPSSEQSLNILSFGINCEKWKFECMKRIDGSIDWLEKKFKAKLEMKNKNTVYVNGEGSNLEQLRVDLNKLMKQLVREIQPVGLELYENLEADQDYKKNMDFFENKYHVALELGKYLDYENNVEIQLGGLHVILTQAMKGDNMLRIELQDSGQGFKIVIDGTKCPTNTLKGNVNLVIERCVTQCLVVDLDSIDGHEHELCSFLSDFLTCFLGEKTKGLVYTVYICTAKARLYCSIKKLLTTYDQPVAERMSHAGHATDPYYRMEVVVGELAKQKVDVIVNTSNNKLRLDRGAVSNSLLKIAGQEMQQEVSLNYPGGIKPGQIAETMGYRLGVSRVLHCCLQAWNTYSEDKQNGCRQELMLVVRKSLERTALLKKTSIAFPALGTGVLKFPPEVVALDMINTVQQHYKDNPNSSIQKVLFVIYTKDLPIYEVFKSTLDEKKNKAENTEFSEYCVAIAGTRDRVAEAKTHIRRELSTEMRIVDISRRRQEDTLEPNNSKRENSNPNHCRPNRDNLTKGGQKQIPSFANRDMKKVGTKSEDNKTKKRQLVNSDNTLWALDWMQEGGDQDSMGKNDRRHQNFKDKVAPSPPQMVDEGQYESIDGYRAGLTPDKGAIPNIPTKDISERRLADSYEKGVLQMDQQTDLIRGHSNLNYRRLNGDDLVNDGVQQTQCLVNMDMSTVGRKSANREGKEVKILDSDEAPSREGKEVQIKGSDEAPSREVRELHIMDSDEVPRSLDDSVDGNRADKRAIPKKPTTGKGFLDML